MTRTSYEDVQRLVIKMREGSFQARRELIEAHVGLAFKASQDYEDDEALSDCLFVLVQEVDTFRVSGRHPAALPSYLKVALTNAAAAHRRNDQVNRKYRHDSRNDAIRFIQSGREQPEHRGLQVVDLMDQLVSLCETDEEREMLFWRSYSMTYAEVASKMRINTTHVANSMARLQVRFGVQEKLVAIDEHRVTTAGHQHQRKLNRVNTSEAQRAAIQRGFKLGI